MKIAQVLSSLHTGGAERIALLIVERLARAGHDVTVVSLEEPRNGALAPEFEAAGARIVRVEKKLNLLDRTLQDFAAVRATGRPEPDGDLAFDVDPLLEAAADAVAAAGAPGGGQVVPLVPR